MPRIRLIVGAAALTAILAIAAPAQTPAQKPDTTQSSTIDKAKSWTEKKWDTTKAEWRKGKAKWDACNQQAADQQLKGRARWSYVYDCMKRK